MQNPLDFARDQYQKGHFNEAFDIYEQLLRHYPGQGVQILAEVYDKFQLLPSSDRYALYQSRYHDFDIKPGERVLDIGSGDIPFKYATDLADIAIEDDKYGRAGVPFKYIAGKPVFECNVEELPFDDKEFDFVYCSHVLEHVAHPEKACDELMRVAKRGFIETPTRAKDLWLNTAKLSRHRWAVEKIKDVLIFTELTPAADQFGDTSVIVTSLDHRRHWIEPAVWYTPGKIEYRDFPEGKKIVAPFIRGGFYAISRTAIEACDIPDRRLVHNNGDWTTGMALHHRGFKIADHLYGVTIGDEPRRGIHEDKCCQSGEADAKKLQAEKSAVHHLFTALGR